MNEYLSAEQYNRQLNITLKKILTYPYILSLY